MEEETFISRSTRTARKAISNREDIMEI